MLPVALAFIVVGVYMTYNRASWLGVAITLLVMATLRPWQRRLLLPALLVLAIVALVFWQSVVSSPAVSERLLEGQSLGYRSTVARLALDMVRDDPLFGLGYYNFGPIAKQRYGWDPAPLFGIYPPAHNSLMFILVSGGLLALLPYVAWFGMVAWQGARRYPGCRWPGGDARRAGRGRGAVAALLRGLGYLRQRRCGQDEPPLLDEHRRDLGRHAAGFAPPGGGRLALQPAVLANDGLSTV